MSRSRLTTRWALLLASLTCLAPTGAASEDWRAEVDRRSAAVEPQVIAWRRDLHEHPELSNRETRTAGVVAKELERLGIETRTGIAATGVIGILRGGQPGPVIALRADMDALPVTEDTGLPFASTVRATYLGRDVGVMHACGHDAHTAILLGAAEVLAGMREQVPGTVVFVFQPAEEGAPPGETGGARRMLAEGAFDDPRPGAVVGLHVIPQVEAGHISVVTGGAMAGSDRLRILVKGSQTHAAYPWLGVDPIAVASRIVLALQSLPGRQLDVRHPTVVSIGAIHGGVRGNIIPDEVELLGTIRHLEPAMQEELHARITHTATKIAESANAIAEVEIVEGYPVTYNDAKLVARIRPALVNAVGAENVEIGTRRTGAEDFSFYAEQVPGTFFWLGIRPPGVSPGEAVPNHSPRFILDEAALGGGVKAMAGAVFANAEGQR
jgi:amidohydrolase